MNQQMMSRGGYAPQQQPVDVGGCGAGSMSGYGGGCPAPGGVQTTANYGQLALPGAVHSLSFKLGFMGIVGTDGHFYTASIEGTGSSTKVIYTDIGEDLHFEVGTGFYDICGVNITAGGNVAITHFSNLSSLESIGGDVPADIWDTDGCWCEYDDCLSAANDSSIRLSARCVPDLEQAAAGPITIDVPGGTLDGFFCDFSMAFIGNLYRTVQGCTTVGSFTQLQQCNEQPPACGGAMVGPSNY